MPALLLTNMLSHSLQSLSIVTYIPNYLPPAFKRVLLNVHQPHQNALKKEGQEVLRQWNERRQGNSFLLSLESEDN